ncbi:MAG: hypothetical protein WDN02_03090 [Methylovirgula sp.]|uniref:hypothetical protein n=1 Tax=Methylovirgula sp. TaxID=1978224 RepID=UPI003076474D
MKSVLKKALFLCTLTLTIAIGSPSVAAFAFGGGHVGGYRMRHGGGPGFRIRHAGHAHGYGSDWRWFGWGCGPFGDNEDGWDIGWGSAFIDKTLDYRDGRFHLDLLSNA